MRASVYNTTLLALVFVAAAALIGVRCAGDDEPGSPAWAQSLPGQIVFADQDGGVSAIFRVAANGAGRTRLFRNNDPVDPDALYPSWVDGGRRIRFTAMRSGAWAGFEMGADGAAVHANGDREFRLLSRRSAAPDLEVEASTIWALDAAGRRHFVHREPVTAPPISLSNAAWGPDRDYVIFQACDAASHCAVRVARSDGGGTFTVGPGRHPSWTWATAP